MVDGYNVLHAVLLGTERRERAHEGSDLEVCELEWWAPSYQRRVVLWAESLFRSLRVNHPKTGVVDCSNANAPRVTVVFDARGPTVAHEVSSELVNLVYTPNADDFIVDVCRREVVTVVTADRSLTNRAAVHGAKSVKPWQVNQGQGEALS